MDSTNVSSDLHAHPAPRPPIISIYIKIKKKTFLRKTKEGTVCVLCNSSAFFHGSEGYKKHTGREHTLHLGITASLMCDFQCIQIDPPLGSHRRLAKLSWVGLSASLRCLLHPLTGGGHLISSRFFLQCVKQRKPDFTPAEDDQLLVRNVLQAFLPCVLH